MMIGEIEVSNPSALDSCIQAIRSLSIKADDVLVLRLDSHISSETLRNISESLRAHLGERHKDNLVIVLGESIDLSLLNEEAMKKHGWARATTEPAAPLDDQAIEILDLRRQLKEAQELSASREKDASARRHIAQILGENTIESVEVVWSESDIIEGTPYSTLIVRLRTPADDAPET